MQAMVPGISLSRFGSSRLARHNIVRQALRASEQRAGNVGACHSFTKRTYGSFRKGFLPVTTERKNGVEGLGSHQIRGAQASAQTGGSGPGTETHGGDDIHRVGQLVCDFSVTTNALGPVPSAVEATRSILASEDNWVSNRGGDVKAILDEDETHVMSAAAIEHYPQREDKELTRLVAEFFRPDGDAATVADVEASLIFGNGASELIDLLPRSAPQGPYYVSPLTKTQYKEYERACEVSGRQRAEKVEDASVVAIVNPTNPTGDFVERLEMENWISANAVPGSWIIVDESMLFWAGPDWHKRGVSREFVQRMQKRDIHIYLVYSWTKIFSCTGLRIGSVIAPTPAAMQELQAKQVPWSVSVLPRTYLKAALQHKEYLEKTWRLTPQWRENMITKLKRLHPDWQFLGQPWTSWVWIDTGNEAVAKAVYEASLECSCPVRHAAAGYNLPTIVRIAVRRPYDFAVLYQALLRQEYASNNPGRAPLGTYADVHPSVVEGVELVHIDDLYRHEKVLTDREGKLNDYVKDLPLLTLPAIIVDARHKVVIDGHHRLELFRQGGMTIVPAVFVNYEHDDIVVNPPEVEDGGVTKDMVIKKAINGDLLAPKSTQHMVRSRGGSLMPIIVLAPQIAEIRS